MQFSEFPNLQELYLEGCFIRHVDVDVFAELGGAPGGSLPITSSRLDILLIEGNLIVDLNWLFLRPVSDSLTVQLKNIVKYDSGIGWVQVLVYLKLGAP